MSKEHAFGSAVFERSLFSVFRRLALGVGTRLKAMLWVYKLVKLYYILAL